MANQKERRATPRKPAAPKAEPVAEKPTPVARNATGNPSPEELRRTIEENAYFKAKARGFEPGYELEDWLQAEREVKQQR